MHKKEFRQEKTGIVPVMAAKIFMKFEEIYPVIR